MTKHSFNNCPLRSCSLLIINKQNQTIVTATDEVFNFLGYEPNQLIGKSLHLLNPRYIEPKKYFLFRNEVNSDIPFQVCIHQDPLNTVDLEYWLLKPAITLNNNMNTSITILRLSPFGSIENAYPSSQFPQADLNNLVGHPVMSFIHKADVRLLCEKLKQCRLYETFNIRWLKKHPRHGQEDDFLWVSFTVIHTPSHYRRLSCSTMHDPETRPICIIRPIHSKESEDSVKSIISLINSTTVNDVWLYIKELVSSQATYGLDLFYKLVNDLNEAIDQGKTYLVEFFAHIITHLLRFICDVNQHISTIEESTSESIMNKNNRILKSSYKHITLVKVAIDNYIWSVPLFDTIIKRSNSQENLTKLK